MKYNPLRQKRILAATGWLTIYPGTLNLGVDKQAFDGLLRQNPLITEPGFEVVYPDRFEHIPLQREAYLYYRATASYRDQSADVLVRRPKVPVVVRLELFAENFLRERLSVKDGDVIEVLVR